MTSPVGKVIGRMMSDGTSVDSLQWIRVSSRSNTIVLVTMIIYICKEIKMVYISMEEKQYIYFFFQG